MITAIIVIGVVLYWLKKRPGKKVKKKSSNKRKAKALTKFILNCKRRKIPKKRIKKLLTGKGWPNGIVEEYVKEIFS